MTLIGHWVRKRLKSMQKQLVSILADLVKRLAGVVSSQIHYAISYDDPKRREQVITEGFDALENVIKRARQDVEKLFEPTPAQAEGDAK